MIDEKYDPFLLRARQQARKVALKIALQFLPRIEENNVENMWYQEGGATCHTGRETI